MLGIDVMCLYALIIVQKAKTCTFPEGFWKSNIYVLRGSHYKDAFLSL